MNSERETDADNVTFNASGLASSVSLYPMQAGSFEQTRKLIVAK